MAFLCCSMGVELSQVVELILEKYPRPTLTTEGGAPCAFF